MTYIRYFRITNSSLPSLLIQGHERGIQPHKSQCTCGPDTVITDLTFAIPEWYLGFEFEAFSMNVSTINEERRDDARDYAGINLMLPTAGLLKIVIAW